MKFPDLPFNLSVRLLLPFLGIDSGIASDESPWRDQAQIDEIENRPFVCAR